MTKWGTIKLLSSGATKAAGRKWPPVVLGLLLFSSVSATPASSSHDDVVGSHERLRGRILYWLPTGAKSMQMSSMQFVNALVDRGHEVTMVAPYKEGLERENLRIIQSKSDYEQLWVRYSKTVMANGVVQAPPFSDILAEALKGTDSVLSNPEFKALLSSKFDVVMVKMYVASEAGYYLAHHFGARLVLYTTIMSSFSIMDHAMAMPHNTAYLPYVMTPMQAGEMSFFERVKNTVLTNLIEHVGRNYMVLNQVNALLDKHFPNDASRPSLLELEHSAAVAIHSGHPLLMDGLRPIAPNFVYTGMMVCQEKLKPMDDKLRAFIEGGKEQGVILVSFGSGVVLGSQMSDENLSILLRVFGRLKERVVWKLEAGDRDLKAFGLSDNVYVSPWLPQNSIASHRNVKAAVIHGGIRSTQEALCYKKPVVITPVFGDQPVNAGFAERRGFGLAVPFATLTEDKLFSAIRRVIDTPEYLAAATKFGSLVSEQESPPLEKAIWWIEQAIKHPDLAKLYRSPVHDLTWYQFYLLDVAIFLLAILGAILIIATTLLKGLLRRLFKKPKIE